MNIFNALPYRTRFKLGFFSILSPFIFLDDEAILAKLRSEGVVESIRSLSDAQRRMLHFDFGRNIRNRFLLWHPKNPYTTQKLRTLSAERQADSPYHPDNYSWSIISRLVVEATPATVV